MPDDEPAAGHGASRGGRLGFVVTACLASAALAAPIAIGATGSSLVQGARNPSVGSAARETLVIASTAADVYGTRQSNVGDGGAAIYGCRTTADLGDLGNPAVSTPCLRVNNLGAGLVFNFRFARGAVGGVYQAGPTTLNDLTARPFITNATGIASGLNADKVDGTKADDIIATIRASGVGPQGPKGANGDAGAPGPMGPPGIPGARGKWYTGADDPNTTNPSGSQPGDFYLDLVDPGVGDVYEKSSSGPWALRINIRGPGGPPQTQAFINDYVAAYCSQAGRCRNP
jgi:hypothetical protein